MRLLYVHKFNPQDPTDLALRKWFVKEMDGTAVFTFAPDERTRSAPSTEPPLRRFQEAVERHRATHVFCWGPYPNAAELRWLRERGLVVAVAVSGVSGLSHGNMRDQAEYFDYLRQVSYFLTPHAPHVPVFRGLGVNALELPFCYDEETYRPVAARELLRRLAPVDGSYIGNFGPPEIAQGQYRASVIRELSRAFRLLLVCDSRYRDYGLGGGGMRRLPTIVNPSILNLILNASGFTLGTDAFPEIDEYYRPHYSNVKVPYDRARDGFVMRPRTFWSMGAGAPFLVEDYPEIRRFFRDGEDVMLWKKPADAVEQLLALRRDPGKLARIGATGQAKVRRLHSARVRVRQLRGILAGGAAPDFTAEVVA